jgi:hypothetical protein
MKYSNRLSDFISDKPIKEEHILSNNGKRLFRSLKSLGERSIKGRDINKCIFEVVYKNGIETLRMLIEGRHALSISNQIAKSMVNMSELEFVDVVKTKKGAKVVLRPIGG